MRGATASCVLVAVSLSGGSVARADEFKPVPSPPVVVIVDAPGDSAADPIQPKYPNSGGATLLGGVYTVEATVATNATLAALETVTMCWYRNGLGGDTNCSIRDPQESFAMQWTEATAAASPAGGTAGFSVLTAAPFETTAYANVESRTETTANTGSYDATKNSMTIKFSFRVSNAMHADDDWEVRVTALYEDDLCDEESCGWTLTQRTGEDDIGSRHVAYWGEMTTAWEPLGFGVVNEDGTSPELSATEFAFVANATSDYKLTGTDFTSEDTPTVDTLALVSGTPTGKQVLMECWAIDYPDTVFVAIETVPAALGASIPATGETINTTETITCRLSYGSGAAYALRIYSSQVVLAVGQSAGPA